MFRDYDFHITIFETPSDKPGGSRVAPANRASLEPYCVSQRELRELEDGFPELEILCL
jgi:hypothetical protein